MRIEVEPDTLIGAGQQMGSLGSQLGMLSDALGGALSGGIASGTDPAGLNFGLKYGHQAGDFANAVADAANAFNSVGLLLEATGYNYKNADAASTIGGQGPTGGVSGEPSKTMAAHVPPGPNGLAVPPPAMWHLIQPLLQVLPGFGLFAGTAMTWPSGHSAMMGVTAVQWRNFATGFALIEPQLAAVKSAVGAQSIPERAAIVSALDSLGQAITSLADVSSSVAQSITDFAGGVQATQHAIRRFMDRLSIGGLWDTVTGFLTGEGDDILREVARDVGTVLDNFQQQVKGIVGLLDELVVLIGEAATAFQKWIRPILVEQFGDGVGGVLADAVTLYTDVQVGAVTGLIGTVSGAVALADPDTWKGMAELALSVAQDPSTLPGVLSNMGKEFVAWDKWSGDHPGRAAGEAAFNIGSLFVPGGALSKTGSVAKGLTLTRRVLDEGRLPQLGGLGGWTRATNVDNLGSTPRVPEVPPVRPGAIPGPTQPSAPTGPGPGRAEGGPGQRVPLEQPGRGSGPPPAATGLPPAFHDGATSIGDHPATPDTTSVQPGPSDYAPSGPDIAAELNDAFIRGDSTSALAREVADLSTHRIPSPTGDFAQEDRVVLGKWDGMDGGYIGEARHNGGIYYDTGDLTWDAMRAGLDDGQTRRLGWEINEQFLRTQLENGVSRIEYVLPPDFGSVEQLAAVQRLSFSAMEINFLKSNAGAFGYVQHGNTWIREGAGSQ